MKRSTRVVLAQETLAICKAGEYRSANGRTISIRDELHSAKAGTRLYSLENPPILARKLSTHETQIEVTNETTQSALAKLSSAGHLACLNFSSAKNPGGGFLNGSQAQEESLARSSTLYPTLLTQPDFYSRNRANDSCLYLDLAIYSPSVVFFRDDEGTLLDEPIKASVITSPAPNKGAIENNTPEQLPLVEETLQRRARLVLDIAAAHAVSHLVLGAWGCGVFRNDPAMVARCFANLMPAYAPFFELVHFAVFDPSAEQKTYLAFREELEPLIIQA